MMMLFSMITTNHYHHHVPPIFMVPLRGAGWSTTTERDRDRGGQTQGDGKTRHLKAILIVLHFLHSKWMEFLHSLGYGAK